jgi:hypothetical protein
MSVNAVNETDYEKSPNFYFRNPKVKASDVISVFLGVSFPLRLSGEKWVKIFKSKDAQKVSYYRPMLEVFFYDVPGPAIRDFMEENDVSMDDLKFAYSFIPLSAIHKSFEEWVKHGFER